MATVELVTATALARVAPHEDGRGRDGRGHAVRAGRARVARGAGLAGPPPVAGITGVHRDRLACREPRTRADGGRWVGRGRVAGVRHVHGGGDVGVVVLVGREGGQAALDEAGVGLGLGGRTRPLGIGAEERVLALALGQRAQAGRPRRQRAATGRVGAREGQHEAGVVGAVHVGRVAVLARPTEEGLVTAGTAVRSGARHDGRHGVRERLDHRCGQTQAREPGARRPDDRGVVDGPGGVARHRRRRRRAQGDLGR